MERDNRAEKTFRERRQYRMLKLQQSRQARRGAERIQLSDIDSVVDSKQLKPMDKAELRQLKNRESAIRSRQRKDELIEILSQKIGEHLSVFPWFTMYNIFLL